MQTEYQVTGMTCQHCVAHVTEEVTAIPGVEAVDVNLDGTMIVTSREPIGFDDIEEAVTEAGNYQVTPAD